MSSNAFISTFDRELIHSTWTSTGSLTTLRGHLLWSAFKHLADLAETAQAFEDHRLKTVTDLRELRQRLGALVDDLESYQRRQEDTAYDTFTTAFFAGGGTHFLDHLSPHRGTIFVGEDIPEFETFAARAWDNTKTTPPIITTVDIHPSQGTALTARQAKDIVRLFPPTPKPDATSVQPNPEAIDKGKGRVSDNRDTIPPLETPDSDQENIDPNTVTIAIDHLINYLDDKNVKTPVHDRHEPSIKQPQPSSFTSAPVGWSSVGFTDDRQPPRSIKNQKAKRTGYLASKPKPPPGYKCHKCGGRHIQYDCFRYICYVCNRPAPGHAQMDCPKWPKPILKQLK
jgi:hypothetical protein